VVGAADRSAAVDTISRYRGWVIAVGTTVVRALESAVGPEICCSPADQQLVR
jgi:S-adenosylmethionine:tRNA-ribosyltransferase-isomerase (queuine synthetase)